MPLKVSTFCTWCWWPIAKLCASPPSIAASLDVFLQMLSTHHLSLTPSHCLHGSLRMLVLVCQGEGHSCKKGHPGDLGFLTPWRGQSWSVEPRDLFSPFFPYICLAGKPVGPSVEHWTLAGEEGELERGRKTVFENVVICHRVYSWIALVIIMCILKMSCFSCWLILIVLLCIPDVCVLHIMLLVRDL